MKSRSVGLIVCIWSAASAHTPPASSSSPAQRGCASVGFIWMSFTMAWCMGTYQTHHNKISPTQQQLSTAPSGCTISQPSFLSPAAGSGAHGLSSREPFLQEKVCSPGKPRWITPQPVCSSSFAVKLLLFYPPILHKGTIMLPFCPLTCSTASSLL